MHSVLPHGPISLKVFLLVISHGILCRTIFLEYAVLGILHV